MSLANHIPAQWGDVTPDWMTAALARSHPGCVVDRVDPVLVDDGTNRRARFAIEYSSGNGPATVFLKASDLGHAELNAATGGLFNEARLFASETVLPVDHPTVHHVVIDEPNLDFIMVMEDIVARGCDPRDANRPLTIQQASNGLRALARLHSAYWSGEVREAPRLAWVEPFKATYSLERGIDIGKDKIGGALPPEVLALSGSDIDTIWHAYPPTVLTGAQTLLHGDPHVGNTYVCADDELGFLDWQVVHIGNPSLDVAYFLQGALEVADRRAAERSLLETYLAALSVPDETRPTFEDLWRRYRAGASYGMALWLATAASRWQRPEISATLALRYSTAFADLASAQAVEEAAALA